MLAGHAVALYVTLHLDLLSNALCGFLDMYMVSQQEHSGDAAHYAALHAQVAEMYNKQMVLSKSKAKATDDED